MSRQQILFWFCNRRKIKWVATSPRIVFGWQWQTVNARAEGLESLLHVGLFYGGCSNKTKKYNLDSRLHKGALRGNPHNQCPAPQLVKISEIFDKRKKINFLAFFPIGVPVVLNKLLELYWDGRHLSLAIQPGYQEPMEPGIVLRYDRRQMAVSKTTRWKR